MRGYVEVKQCASISLLIWLTLSVVRVFSPEPSSSHGTASELSTGKRGMRDESQEGLTAGLLGSSYALLSTSGGVMGSKGDSGNLEATPTPCGQLGDAADPGCTHSSALVPRIDGARQAGPSTASAGLLHDELREGAAAAAAATTATASPSTPGFVACTPYASHDVAVERCESYCAIQHRSFHCRLCKCKACAFCRANASAAAGGRSADAEDGGVDRRGEREARGRRGRRGRGRRGRGRGARARGASRGARDGEVHGRRGGAIADPLDEAEAEGEREEEVESVPTSATAAALASASASASERSVAVGVLTQSRDSPRWLALEATWIHQFDQVMVFESHTDVAKARARAWHRRKSERLWRLGAHARPIEGSRKRERETRRWSEMETRSKRQRERQAGRLRHRVGQERVRDSDSDGDGDSDSDSVGKRAREHGREED
eukprot:3797524-Pleurochrysis_carterae.AAC.2